MYTHINIVILMGRDKPFLFSYCSITNSYRIEQQDEKQRRVTKESIISILSLIHQKFSPVILKLNIEIWKSCCSEINLAIVYN